MNPLRPICRSFARPTAATALPIRTFTTSTALSAPKSTSSANKKEKLAKEKNKKRRKKMLMHKMPNLNDLQQFSLCDAMQHIQAFEVGRNPSVPKYELAVRLKCKKDGPVLRNSIQLPWSVKTDIRVCALVDPKSKAGLQAKEAGATVVGLDDVFEQIKEGKIDFERCITTAEYLPQIAKAGMPRILGPRGLMPSTKLGTVTDNPAQTIKNLLGGSTYRERGGVVRMSIGQLAFNPDQLRDNLKAFIAQLKREAAGIAENQGFTKEVFEIVLSSTNSPGFSLSGEFRRPGALNTQQLAAA